MITASAAGQRAAEAPSAGRRRFRARRRCRCRRTPPRWPAIRSAIRTGGGGSWLSLAGADASSFNFSSGSLSFRSAPDYETDAQYQVTVRAQGGCSPSSSASRSVTVNILDVGPPGTPSLTLSVPSSGGHKNLDASWTVPSSGAGITGYQLQYCTSGARDDGESPANSGGQDPSARATCSTHSVRQRHHQHHLVRAQIQHPVHGRGAGHQQRRHRGLVLGDVRLHPGQHRPR